MNQLLPKLKNFWYYHKFHLLIAAAAVAVVIYSFIPGSEQDYDYRIGIVSALPCSDERLEKISARIAAAGRDINSDGGIKVALNSYAVDMESEDPNAGYMNYEKVAALDADLVGKVSGLYLLEAPEAFQQATDGLMAEPFAVFDGQFSMAVRGDAAPEYIELFEALK